MKPLSAFWLKLIALAAMTVDHIGAIFYPDPEYIWMRLVGRIACPIFAFLIAEGFRHTKDVRRYAIRLLAFAVISMYPYYLAFGWTQNVLFSLLCGLLALWGMENAETNRKKALVLLLACLLAGALLCDWHVLGVLMVVGFYYADRSPWKTGLVLLLAAALQLGIFWVYARYIGNPEIFDLNRIQIGILLAFPFLCAYNGKRGRFSLRYFFYAYYPAHLLVLYAIGTYAPLP